MASNNHRIKFEKPDLALLTKDHTVVDMHFHSNYTDGMPSVAKIASRARQLGIGIAMTDHNDIRAALELENYPDVLNIPGIEVTAKEGTHLLIYFYQMKDLQAYYQKTVEPCLGNDIMSSLSLGLDTLIKKARQFNSLTIFPHPYCAAYTGVNNLNFSAGRVEQLLNSVDGVEVINSENVKKWNLKSALLGFNLEKAITGGSDGHSLYQMGRVVSYAKCKNERKSFLDAVKLKRNRVMGKEIHLLGKVGSSSYKLKSTIRNCPDIMEKNFRYGRNAIQIKSKILKNNLRQRMNDHLKSVGTKTGS